eukprot:1842869-Rhodomonas_salina.6
MLSGTSDMIGAGHDDVRDASGVCQTWLHQGRVPDTSFCCNVMWQPPNCQGQMQKTSCSMSLSGSYLDVFSFEHEAVLQSFDQSGGCQDWLCAGDPQLVPSDCTERYEQLRISGRWYPIDCYCKHIWYWGNA